MSMPTKLAGHLPLQDMITQVITESREMQKLAAEEKDEEKKDEKKAPPFAKKDEKKGEEKKASVAIDANNVDEVEKLASALDTIGDELIKEADSIELGGEKKQGGEVLPTQSPTGGKQPYKKDSSKSHNVPTSTGMMSTKDNKGPSTAVPTDDTRAPGGNGAKYPAKGVLKTAAMSVKEMIEAKKAKGGDKDKKDDEKHEEHEKKEAPAEEKKEHEKKAAVDFVLNKIAEVKGGGEVLTTDVTNSPVPSNPGRQLIANNKAPASATKREAKSPRKAELAQVLTEPAMSAAHDSKVNENLRNASKGGVKIAAAKALLQKIAEEGCTCKDGEEGSCRHCKMKKAMAKQAK